VKKALAFILLTVMFLVSSFTTCASSSFYKADLSSLSTKELLVIAFEQQNSEIALTENMLTIVDVTVNDSIAKGMFTAYITVRNNYPTKVTSFEYCDDSIDRYTVSGPMSTRRDCYEEIQPGEELIIESFLGSLKDGEDFYRFWVQRVVLGDGSIVQRERYDSPRYIVKALDD